MMLVPILAVGGWTLLGLLVFALCVRADRADAAEARLLSNAGSSNGRTSGLGPGDRSSTLRPAVRRRGRPR
jgi:hypothetical protein